MKNIIFHYSNTLKMTSQIKYVTTKMLRIAHILASPSILANNASDRLKPNIMTHVIILLGMIFLP